MATPAAGRPNSEHSERAIISALCQNALPPEQRAQVMHQLTRYRFADPQHQIIFQALSGLPHVETTRILELLPGRVTNLGLPDVNLDTFFTPQIFDEATVNHHLQVLFPAAPQNS
jgi:hypothetical protein